MSSSTEIDNRRKDILILLKGPTQALEHTLSAEKLNSINFADQKEQKILSLHYNKENSYLFVNGPKIIKSKSKDPEIIPHSLCLEKISKKRSVDNMKKTEFNTYLYDFSVDYDAIAADDVLDIHKYFMKKKKKMI